MLHRFLCEVSLRQMRPERPVPKRNRETAPREWARVQVAVCPQPEAGRAEATEERATHSSKLTRDTRSTMAHEV